MTEDISGAIDRSAGECAGMLGWSCGVAPPRMGK
jgi:hypothetical protein